jgi:hypothetical protein
LLKNHKKSIKTVKNTKNSMIKALPYLLASLLIYLSFSFIMWELNPQMWTESTRAAFIFVWIGVVAITHCTVEIIKLRK